MYCMILWHCIIFFKVYALSTNPFTKSMWEKGCKKLRENPNFIVILFFFEGRALPLLHCQSKCTSHCMPS